MRDGEQAGIARVFQTVTLQRAQIIGIAKLGAYFFKEIPIMLLAIRADLLFKMALEVGGNAVVVEQRVVDVKEEDEIRHGDGEKSIPKTHLKSKLMGCRSSP